MKLILALCVLFFAALWLLGAAVGALQHAAPSLLDPVFQRWGDSPAALACVLIAGAAAPVLIMIWRRSYC